MRPTLLLLPALACACASGSGSLDPAETSDTAPVVDSAPPVDTAPPADTGPPVHTGDTGTGDTAPTDTATTPYDPLCAGDGSATLEMGSGGLLAFQPFADGAPLQIVAAPGGGDLGVTLEIRTEGLDTHGFVNAVLRVDTDLDDTLYLGMLALQCPAPGPGWVSLHADFGADVQADVAAGLWDGQAAQLTLTLTDETYDAATATADVVLVGP